MISFTQRNLAAGTKRTLGIVRSEEIQKRADELVAAGWRFEIEESEQYRIRMTVEKYGAPIPLAFELCRNYEMISEHVDMLINTAWYALRVRS